MENTKLSQMDTGAPRSPEKMIEQRVIEVRQPVTIERTDKQYKFGILVGFIIMLMGIGSSAFLIYRYVENYNHIPYTFAALAEDQRAIYVSLAGIVFGFILFYLEKFLAWWNNG